MLSIRLLEFNRIPGAPWLTPQSAAVDLSLLTGEEVIEFDLLDYIVTAPEIDYTIRYYDLMQMIQTEDRGRFSCPWACD